MIRAATVSAFLQVALPNAARPAVVAVGILYFAVVLGISVWAARRTRTAADFFVAGKGIGLVALTVASVSVSVSGFAFIGGPGFIYAVGLGAMYIVLPAAVTNVMGAWVLAKRMRLLGEARALITIPDAIGARYRSRGAQGLSALAILVGIVGYMATNALAMGVVINSIFGVGLGWGIWIGMGVTLAYSASGGILAGIYNDVFQGTLMAVASVLVFLFVLDFGGGLGEISRTILAYEPTFLGPWGKITPLAALSFFFVFSMGSLGQPQAVHKYYMLRDPLQLKWYPLLKTLGLVLVLLLYFSVGVGVKAFVLSGRLAPLASPDQATPALLLNVTPIILAALVFSGVAAATMSGDSDARFAGRLWPAREERVALGKGGNCSDRHCGRDHSAAIRDDGGISRDFRVGSVCLDAGPCTGRGTELARRDTRWGHGFYRNGLDCDARARDRCLLEGVHLSCWRDSVSGRNGGFVPGVLHRVVGYPTHRGGGDRP